jgi:mannose-1-phosphate guanylyltransferase / phosphomannomutase
MTPTHMEPRAPITRDPVAPTGIILAGTHPWSNSTFDALLPRPLLPIAHRPLISYSLSWLKNSGVDRVAVCGNRETRLLQTRLVNHVPSGMSLSYLEDPMPRGAAGSARDAALADIAESFVVADGTSIPNVDLPGLLAFHRNSGAAATVVVHEEAREGGKAGLRAPTGIYVFERRALDIVPGRGFYDIKEHLIPRLYAMGERVVMYASHGPAPRVLGASTYLSVNEWVIEQLLASEDTPAGYVRIGRSLVHSEASVASDAVLGGPILIGPGVRVLSGAVVIGPTSLGRNVTVKSGALVSRSAIWRRSIVGANASADRCIVADDAVVGAEERAFRTVVAGRTDHATQVTVQTPVLLDLATWRKTRFNFGRPVGSNLAAQ